MRRAYRSGQSGSGRVAGDAGDIQWNFEKFVVSAGGRVQGRFRPRTEPDAPEVRDCIERALGAS
jgi:glutathione peroxidase